jgi:Ca2+-binding EF-hand superfamily protein
LVELPVLLKALLSDNPHAAVTLKRAVGKQISDFITSRPDLYNSLKSKLQSEDTHHDGYISPEKLFKVLSVALRGSSIGDIDKYVGTLQKDQRGLINY